MRQHDSRIPRDLETIVLKTLSKDPADRCNTAGELRDELRRFLDGRPTRWRRVGAIEQFRRWCKRNRWLAAANITAASMTIVLALGSMIAAWGYRFQRDELQLAQNAVRNQLNLTTKAETKGRERLFESLVAQGKRGA